MNVNISEEEAFNRNDITPYEELVETFIVPVVFVLVFFVGVLGNGGLLLIFVRFKDMRNVPNTFILSLALGDLLFIVTAVRPLTESLIDYWPYGEFVCKLSEVTRDVSIGVSVYTLTALSAERCYAIVNPIQKHLSTKKTTITAAFSIWIVSSLLALPAAIFSHVETEEMETNEHVSYCISYPEGTYIYFKVMVLFRFVIYYAVPFCLIGIFYGLMAKNLVASAKNVPGESQRQSNLVRSRKKVAKIVLALAIIFMVCYFPYQIFLLSVLFHPSGLSHSLILYYTGMFGFWLSFINSCINPIALYCLSETFRKHFNKLLPC